MSKSRSRKRTTSQTLLWLLSLFLIGSMVIGLLIGALSSAPASTPEPTLTDTPTPTLTPTSPILGPELPTATPTLAATPSPASLSTTGTEAAPTPQLSFTFAVAGDSRDNPEVYGGILDLVSASGSRFLIHTGDLVSSGTEKQWKGFDQIMAGFSLPFYPVPGNHDALRGKLDGYLAHSGAPQAHYSFDYGPVHFSMADSHNGGLDAAELDWLRRDLDATRQPLKMVILHHPPFDPDGTTHIMAYGNDAFMGLMAEEGVDYVFAGHIHAYAQAVRDGVVYVYTGGAGAPLYRQHPQAFYHYLLVSVDGTQVAIQVTRV
jgi:3',5'-cyclic AMP phosphodiesterase CpdA